MNAGTRILLALITVIVGILVVYYGVLMPDGPRSMPIEDPLVLAQPEAAEVRTDPADPLRTGAAADDAGPRRRLLPARPAPDRASPSTAPPGTGSPDPAPRSNAGPRDAAAGVRAAEVPAAGSGPGSSSPPGRPRLDPPPARRAAAPPPAVSRAPATAPPPTEPRREPPAYTDYVVQDGDTMTSIAEWWFGDHRRWDLIAKANLVDPNRLAVGQTLRLPPRDADHAPVSRASTARATTYVVRAGDTLSRIARAIYDEPAAWERLHEANRRTIGPDPDALEVGMTLTIPATR